MPFLSNLVIILFSYYHLDTLLGVVWIWAGCELSVTVSVCHFKSLYHQFGTSKEDPSFPRNAFEFSAVIYLADNDKMTDNEGTASLN